MLYLFNFFKLVRHLLWGCLFYEYYIHMFCLFFMWSSDVYFFSFLSYSSRDYKLSSILVTIFSSMFWIHITRVPLMILLSLALSGRKGVSQFQPNYSYLNTRLRRYGLLKWMRLEWLKVSASCYIKQLPSYLWPPLTYYLIFCYEWHAKSLLWMSNGLTLLCYECPIGLSFITGMLTRHRMEIYWPTL